MAKPREGFSDQLVSKLVVGLVVVVIGWFVLKVVLGWIYSLVTAAVMIALLGVVLWFVLIGPPGDD
jgi:hypothetical protein